MSGFVASAPFSFIIIMPHIIRSLRSNRKATLATVAVISIDSWLFGGTNAQAVPPFMVIVAFLALLGTLALAWYGIFSLLQIYGIHFRHKHRLAVYMSALLSGIIALQSIGELSKRDIIVLFPLIVLGYLYSAYNRSPGRNLE